MLANHNHTCNYKQTDKLATKQKKQNKRTTLIFKPQIQQPENKHNNKCNLNTETNVKRTHARNDRETTTIEIAMRAQSESKTKYIKHRGRSSRALSVEK